MGSCSSSQAISTPSQAPERRVSLSAAPASPSAQPVRRRSFFQRAFGGGTGVDGTSSSSESSPAADGGASKKGVNDEVVKEGKFVPAKDLLRLPDLPSDAQIEAFIDEILQDKNLNAKGIPDSVEKNVYKRIISTALEQALMAIFALHGKEFLGHHLQAAKVGGKIKVFPEADKLNRKAIRALAKELLEDDAINMTWVHDSVEEDIYNNLITVVLIIIQAFFASSKLQLIGHTLQVDMRPSVKQVISRVSLRDEAEFQKALELVAQRLQQEEDAKRGGKKKAFNMGIEESLVKTVFALVVVVAKKIMNDVRINYLGDQILFHVIPGPAPPKEVVKEKTHEQEEEEIDEEMHWLVRALQIHTVLQCGAAAANGEEEETWSSSSSSSKGGIEASSGSSPSSSRRSSSRKPKSSKFVPERELLRLREPRPEAQLAVYVDALVLEVQKDRGVASPGTFEKKVFFLVVTKVMSVCQDVIYALNGKEFVGHHLQIETRRGPLPEPPKSDRINKAAIQKLVKILLQEEAINLSFIPDSVEEALYCDIIVLVFVIFQNFLESIDIDFIGHSLSLLLTAQECEANTANAGASTSTDTDTAASSSSTAAATTTTPAATETPTAAPAAAAAAATSEDSNKFIGTALSNAGIEAEVEVHVPRTDNCLFALLDYRQTIERPLLKTLLTLAVHIAHEVTSEMKISCLGDTVFLHVIPGKAPPKQTQEEKIGEVLARKKKEEEAEAASKKASSSSWFSFKKTSSISSSSGK